MIGMCLISALCGLMGVLAGMLYKAKVIEDIRDDYHQGYRTMWQNMTRLGDEQDALRARIYDLEQQLKDRQDDGR